MLGDIILMGERKIEKRVQQILISWFILLYFWTHARITNICITWVKPKSYILLSGVAPVKMDMTLIWYTYMLTLCDLIFQQDVHTLHHRFSRVCFLHKSNLPSGSLYFYSLSAVVCPFKTLVMDKKMVNQHYELQQKQSNMGGIHFPGSNSYF